MMLSFLFVLHFEIFYNLPSVVLTYFDWYYRGGLWHISDHFKTVGYFFQRVYHRLLGKEKSTIKFHFLLCYGLI